VWLCVRVHSLVWLYYFLPFIFHPICYRVLLTHFKCWQPIITVLNYFWVCVFGIIFLDVCCCCCCCCCVVSVRPMWCLYIYCQLFYPPISGFTCRWQQQCCVVLDNVKTKSHSQCCCHYSQYSTVLLISAPSSQCTRSQFQDNNAQQHTGFTVRLVKPFSARNSGGGRIWLR